MSRGWVLLAAAGLLLAGCDQRDDPAAVTVTETQTVVVKDRQPAPAREPLFDAQQCEVIKSMRDTNKKLAQDGYADDYSAQYDQQLRAAGCTP